MVVGGRSVGRGVEEGGGREAVGRCGRMPEVQ